jgi:hypothetical protein
MCEDPVGIDTVDPGGIAYGSRGLSRSDVPPEFVNERATIPEGSQMDMRPRCGRRMAHVRCPGVFAALKPPATVFDPVGIETRNHTSFPGVVAALDPRLPYMTALRSGGESRWDQAKAASASFSASGIRSSPEMSFGRRVSRSLVRFRVVKPFSLDF